MIMIKASGGTSASQQASSSYSCWVTSGIKMERYCLSKCRWWLAKQGRWQKKVFRENDAKEIGGDPKFPLTRKKGLLIFLETVQAGDWMEASRLGYLFLWFLPLRSPVSGFLTQRSRPSRQAPRHTSLLRVSVIALASCPFPSRSGNSSTIPDPRSYNIFCGSPTSSPQFCK